VRGACAADDPWQGYRQKFRVFFREAIAQFAQRLGISVKTLQRSDREGRLKPSRTPSNRRVYTDEQLTHALQRQSALARDTVVYMRVSS
jgi:putative resolvase